MAMKACHGQSGQCYATSSTKSVTQMGPETHIALPICSYGLTLIPYAYAVGALAPMLTPGPRFIRVH